MNRLRYAIALLTLLLTAPGCLIPDDDGPAVLDAGQIAVSTEEDPAEGRVDFADAGEPHRAEGEERRALLTILKGEASTGDKPYDTDLVRTVEADLYRDIDREWDGPKAWITRAKVVDAEGNVLWSDRINAFFQLLEFLKRILDETASVDYSVDEVYAIAETQYPQLLEFGVQVPLGLEGAEEYVLEVPDADGEYYEAGRYKIDELVEQAEPPQFDGEVSTLVQKGPPAERIDVAILGDGYTADQKEEFLGDARAVADRFNTTEPFDQHAEWMNFHAVWTPSEESGAGYDCQGPDDMDCKRDFRDTVFGYTFAVSALVDLFDLDFPAASARVAMPIEVAKLYEVAALASYDEIIMLSNTDRRSGFAGLYVGVLTAFDDRDRFPDVAVHEFGHSFGVLGDEYFIDTDPCLFAAPRVPLPANIGQNPSHDELKWSEWVPEMTPLPTPASQQRQYEVGAYKKAYNCDFLYRPTYLCKMKSSREEFCPVCNQQLVRRLYNDVDLVPNSYPTIERTEAGGLTFRTGVRSEGSKTSVEWRLLGETFAQGPTLTLEGFEVPADWTKLEATVRESSSYVRTEDPRLSETFTWWVRRE